MNHCTLHVRSPQGLTYQTLVCSEPAGGLQHHLAGSVVPLLRGVDGVGMQALRRVVGVVELLRGAWTPPVSLFTDDAPVRDEHLRIESATFQIQGIGDSPWHGTREDVGTDYRSLPFVQMVMERDAAFQRTITLKLGHADISGIPDMLRLARDTGCERIC